MIGKVLSISAYNENVFSDIIFFSMSYLSSAILYFVLKKAPSQEAIAKITIAIADKNTIIIILFLLLILILQASVLLASFALQ